MKLRRLMFAAPKSGSGKTLITCSILHILKEMGEDVVSYKCGPDYIDPMFHKQVLGISSKNLDTFFTGEEVTRELFLYGRTENQIAVLEGVMGVFDGLGGIREEGSSYHLAKVTRTPIILVVDAKGMGYSLIPLIAGFLSYDTEHLIKGVILNRMSGMYYQTLKPLIEEKLQISVVGYVPQNPEFTLESRHLGLKLPEEVEHLREKIAYAGEELQKTLEIEGLLQIADEAEEILETSREKTGVKKVDTEQPVIAVAKDEAFCFYYEDNLRLLEEAGAKLQYFSPVHDTKLPEHCDGILLGGGYPELYAKELEVNREMRDAIKSAICVGVPSVAECGGFMYLHEKLTDAKGQTYEMAGVIPESCHYTGKLVRFGYVEIAEEKTGKDMGMGGNFLPENGVIKAHEFHYFDSTDNGASCKATKPTTGRQYSCIWGGENHWWGFPHLYYPSNPDFAEHFVSLAKRYKSCKLRKI